MIRQTGYFAAKGLKGDEVARLQSHFDSEGVTCTACHRLKNDHSEIQAAACIRLVISELLGPEVNVVGP